MRYVRLGEVSSKDELLAVVRNARGPRKLQVAELLAICSGVEKSGFAAERKRLDAISGGAVRRIDETWQALPARATEIDGPGFVYSGGRPKTVEPSIWAVLEVDAAGRTLTLVKIVDTFTGGQDEERELLADAQDRKERGERTA